MPNINTKKIKFCFWAMVISCLIMAVVFVATDGITGDKEFSEYTREDWKVAAVPLVIIVISMVSTLVFVAMMIFPLIKAFPGLSYYVLKKKFADLDVGTEFLVFDHNEVKRACCARVDTNGLRISVKEYNWKIKSWTVLEYGRLLENREYLEEVLKTDYGYDKIKYCDLYGNTSGSNRPYQML